MTVRLGALTLMLSAAGCAGTAAGPDPAQLAVDEPVVAPPTATAIEPSLTVQRTLVFEGMCDASGAVELDATHFIVADDEDNLLRVYDAERGGAALAAIDVSVPLGLVPKGKRDPRMPELDLEAGTRIGDRAYWLTSHGRNSKGKLRPERLRFFSTTVPGLDLVGGLEVVGSSGALLDALIADPRYASLGLAAAAELAPKAEGGLNLEGMTAGADGSLLLGFRNPVPEGRALLVRLEDPDAMLAGAAPRLGPPIRLDLDGLGVRALSWWRARYLIVAGDRDTGRPSKLYTWDGVGAPSAIAVELGDLNPEGTFSPDGDPRVLLLSDDGTVPRDGVPCKELPDPAQRQFRGAWLAPGA